MDLRVDGRGWTGVTRSLTGLHLSARRRIARKSLRKALTPMRDEAKRLVPVKSGALRASLGIKLRRASGGDVRAVIWPRSKFQFTKQKTKRKFDLKGSSRKSKHPIRYAYFIEFGETKAESPKRKRRAGPSRFLQRAYLKHRQGAVEIFRRDVWSGIQEHLKKNRRT